MTHITVTLDDFLFGEPGCSSRCPIARAIKRTLGVSWVSVGNMTVMFENGVEALLPLSARELVVEVDSSHLPLTDHAEPFTFALDLPWMPNG